MKVLVACECSGRVRDAFRSRGHDAWSCDLEPTASGSDFWWFHYQKDVRLVLAEYWDLIIAHPPCTHLCVSGARSFDIKRFFKLQEKALDFVRMFMRHPCERICIENPVSVISSRIRKPDQIIQPWMFGHKQWKTTCLWLKGLPYLVPTKIIKEREGTMDIGGWYNKRKNRSETFQGIADAMADQWGVLGN